MFNLNSTSPSGFVPWDTNFARKYLQVSKDQMGKLNKIPGWSKTEISEKTAAETCKTLENNEKQLTQLVSASTENILTINSNISTKSDNLKNQNYNPDSQSKQNSIIPLKEKELFLKNVFLSPVKKKHDSANALQRSSSLPDLCEKLHFGDVLPHSNSEEIYKQRVHSKEIDASSFNLAPTLNKTYVVLGVSDDGFNHNKLLEMNRKSCPLEYPNHLSKQRFKALDDSILNHKYLKDIETSVISSDAIPRFPNGTAVQTMLKKEMNLFEKKLLLLEKRLSPAKEMTPPPFNSKLINLENLNREKIPKSPQSPISAEKVVSVVASSNLVEDLPDEIEKSSMSKSQKSLESPSNSQTINEKNEFKNTFEFAKDRPGSASKTCNFDSFISPPLPCGQTVSTEVTSLSQSIPSQKSIELDIPSKLQNSNVPVSGGQLIQTEALSLSKPILYSPSKSQKVVLSGKIMLPKKPIGTCSVFSASSNQKVSDLTSDKELGMKRKRKIRSEKVSKKSEAKKLKMTDIQFSPEQIRSMIEIMKILHTEF